MAYFNVLSWLLSRVSFLGTHVVFAYWLNYLLNDPFNLGGNTLDARVVLPEGKCTPLDRDNLIFDVLLFAAWWLQHSVMARKKFKVAVGLWRHPVERPLFATLAFLTWGANVHFWKPITNCAKWDPLAVSPKLWALSGTLIALASLLIVGLLWSLPDHVFGTGKYKYARGKEPHSNEILRKFPYGLVRHPAATGFIWIYWALPAYTPNHILLASLWSVFILIGTLVFEEGGLRGNDEFGAKYAAYAKEVAPLWPSWYSLQSFLGCPVASPSGKASGKAKTNGNGTAKKSPKKAHTS